MDFGDAGAILIIIIPIIMIILFTLFRTRIRGERTPLEIVASLIREIKDNQKLVEGFSFQLPKKFKTGSWKRNNAGLDFLDQEVQTALSDAFSLAEDFNQQIEAAKKHKSASYLSSITVEKLTEPLAKSKQGLDEWLKENLKTEVFRRPGGLFGR